MHTAILALGSNVAPAKENLDRAVEAVKTLGQISEIAPYIISKPEGYIHQDDFINTVLILKTELAPIPLLRTLKKMETDLGRVKTFPNGPRVIDLDILFYDDLVLFEDTDDVTLCIPHPRIAEREFVLKPLSYIAGDFIHPSYNKPIYRLYRELMKKKGTPSCHIL